MKSRHSCPAAAPFVRPSAALLALSGSTLLAAPAAASPLPLTVVSYSGQSAPGQPAGVTFAFFDQPRPGRDPATGWPILSFWSELAGPGLTSANNQAIYTDRSGALAPVYASGADAPWYTLTTFNAFSQLAAGIDGSIAIVGVVTDTGLPPNSSLEAKNGGIFIESSPGTLLPLAREGEPTPAFPHLAWNNMGSLHTPDSGAGSFWSGTPGIIWRIDGPTPAAAYAPGMTLPGLAPAETIDAIAPHTQGPAGELTLHAQIIEVDPRFPVDAGLWIDRVSGPELLARTGDPAVSGQYTYAKLAPRAAINASGAAAFHAIITDEFSVPSHALFLNSGSTPLPIAIEGDPCPALSGDVRFGSLSALPAINACGHIAFRATLTGADTTTLTNGAIIRRNPDGSFDALLREGDAIADLTGFSIKSLGDPVLMDSGAVVCMASAIDPAATNSGRQVLLAVTELGHVRLVASVGQSIELAPGDSRTIESILWTTDPSGGGNAQAAADGRIAIVLHLAGNAHALVTAYLPPVDDVNTDGLVDILDFLDFVDAFSTCELQPAPCPDSTFNVDLDASGTVDILDFLLFIDAFGSGC